MKEALEVIKKLKTNGYQAYIVGGAVRDYLLKIKPNDIDITTDATPENVSKLFKAYPTGLKFGSVTILYKNKKYEVTTFRKDFDYLDSRRPNKIAYSTDPKEDAIRRDFTINALMLDENLKVYDFTGGLVDLDNKIIRAVGLPDERFKEDALRIMRAFYFVSKLGFNIEPKTMEAINNNAKNITKIAKERVTIELRKTFLNKHNLMALTFLYNSQVINYLPSLKKGLSFIINNQISLFDFELLLLIYILDNNLINEILISNKELHELELFNSFYKASLKVDNYFIYKYGLERGQLYNKIIKLLKPNLAISDKELISINNNLVIKSRKDLAITNPELIEIINKPAGSWIIKLEETVIKKVLNKELKNNLDAIRKYLMEAKNEI